jgi:acyl-CoA reductase-like NAD-dependent aldehyde dehydrogenase
LVPLLVELETRATGRARREYEAQLGRVPEWLEYHASLAESVEGTVPPFADATDHLAIVRRRPLGVCGLITPWNFPLAQGAKKVAAALAAGCTAVWKPAEATPLVALALAPILREDVLPRLQPDCNQIILASAASMLPRPPIPKWPIAA